MTNRLFVALRIPETVLDDIMKIRDDLYGLDPSIKWEQKNKLHITLKFLGDVSDNKLTPIIDSLEKIFSNVSRIYLNFDRFGIFKRNGVPKILWAGIAGNNILKNIVEDINSEMETLGFKKEVRRFNAHITLLRIKGNEDLAGLAKIVNYKLNNLNFIADRITLFKSTLLKQGSVYKELKSFKLK